LSAAASAKSYRDIVGIEFVESARLAWSFSAPFAVLGGKNSKLKLLPNFFWPSILA